VRIKLELGPRVPLFGYCSGLSLYGIHHFVCKFGVAIAVARDFRKNIIEITNKHKGTLLNATPVQIILLANDTGTAQMPSLKVISHFCGVALDVCKHLSNGLNWM
jgi:hypothetical protein